MKECVLPSLKGYAHMLSDHCSIAPIIWLGSMNQWLPASLLGFDQGSFLVLSGDTWDWIRFIQSMWSPNDWQPLLFHFELGNKNEPKQSPYFSSFFFLKDTNVLYPKRYQKCSPCSSQETQHVAQTETEFPNSCLQDQSENGSKCPLSLRKHTAVFPPVSPWNDLGLITCISMSEST